MSNSKTSTKHADILSTQLNAEENQPNSQSGKPYARTPINGSPFYHISSEDGHFATFQKYRITDTFKTEEELYIFLAENQYNVIAIMLAIVLENIGAIHSVK